MTLIQQQRLLGAVLLVCLIGVIAWLLLDTVEQNQPQPQQEEPIAFDSVIEPIAEDVETVAPEQEALVDPEQLGAPVPELSPAPVPPSSSVAETEAPADTEPAPAPAPAPEPEPEPEPMPESNVDSKPAPATATEPAQPQWVLQVASFTVRKNADDLAAQLRQLGHEPMIETGSSAGKAIYRVRLQPVSNRAALETTAKTLSDKLNLNPQIQQYKP
jgi:DedD protein